LLGFALGARLIRAAGPRYFLYSVAGCVASGRRRYADARHIGGAAPNRFGAGPELVPGDWDRGIGERL